MDFSLVLMAKNAIKTLKYAICIIQGEHYQKLICTAEMNLKTMEWGGGMI